MMKSCEPESDRLVSGLTGMGSVPWKAGTTSARIGIVISPGKVSEQIAVWRLWLVMRVNSKENQ